MPLHCAAQLQDRLPFRLGGLGADRIRDVQVDRRGNFLAAGQFEGRVDFDPGPEVAERVSRGGADAFVARFDRFGTLLWAHAFGADGPDGVNSVSTDNQGNVFVAGFFSGTVDFDPGPQAENRSSRGGTDAFLLRLTADGQFSWVITFGDVADDEALAVAADPTGVTYLAGYFQGAIDIDPGPERFNLFSLGETDAFLIRYETGGRLGWGFPLGNIRPDRATSVAIDRNGDILVGGWFSVSADFDPGESARVLVPAGGTDGFLAKYSVEGRHLWSVAFGGPEDDGVNALGVGESRDVWAAGFFRETADFDPSPMLALRTSRGGRDAFLVGFNAQAELLSAMTFGGPGDDSALGVAPDLAAVYVTGAFSGTADFDPGPDVRNITATSAGGATDLFLGRFSLSGALIWVRNLGAPVSGAARGASGAAVALDFNGNALLAGNFVETVSWTGENPFSLTSAGESDALVVRFDRSGAPFRLPGEEPAIAAVTSAANGLPGPVSSLSIFTLWGTQLASSTASYSGFPLPTTLCGIRVAITDGAGRESPAPLYFCSPGQIVLQAAAGLAPGDGRVTIFGDGNRVIATTRVTIAESHPGIFFSGTTAAIVIGTGPRAGELVGLDNPARAGECLLVYATGLGAVDPPARAGELVAALHRVTQPVTIGLGQRILVPDFAGLAPGGPGAYQVNLCLPGDLAPDFYELTVRQADRVSNVARIGVVR